MYVTHFRLVSGTSDETFGVRVRGSCRPVKIPQTGGFGAAIHCIHIFLSSIASKNIRDIFSKTTSLGDNFHTSKTFSALKASSSNRRQAVYDSGAFASQRLNGLQPE